MTAKDFLVDNRSYWQTIKTIRKCLPEFDIISTFAFVIESVDSINRSTFVISTKKKKILRIFYLNISIDLALLIDKRKPYKQVANKSFPTIVFLDRHNRQETNNSTPVEIHRIQTNVIDPYIVHEYHLTAREKSMNNGAESTYALTADFQRRFEFE